MPSMPGAPTCLLTTVPASASKAAAAVVTWVLVLVLLVMAAAFVVLWLRQRMLREDAGDPRASLMEHLRRARDAGDMSDEEFRRARESLLTGSARRARPPMLKGEIHDDGTISARRGFDLTGDPLPSPHDQGTSSSAKTDQEPHEPA